MKVKGMKIQAQALGVGGKHLLGADAHAPVPAIMRHRVMVDPFECN